jgi:hypothetical protein
VRHVFTHFTLDLVLVEGNPGDGIDGGFFHSHGPAPRAGAADADEEATAPCWVKV